MDVDLRSLAIYWWVFGTAALFMLAGQTAGAVSLAGLACFVFYSWRHDRKNGADTVRRALDAVLGMVAFAGLCAGLAWLYFQV